MNSKHKEALEKLDRHLDRMDNPQTPEDYYHALNWEVMVIGQFVTSEYFQTEEDLYRANIEARIGVSLDDDERHINLGEDVRKKMTTSLWMPAVKLILVICQKFGVAWPIEKETHPESRSFKDWWEDASKGDPVKEEYPDFIFENIPRTLLKAAATQMQKVAKAA